jgi:hypothetical protein
MPVAMNRRRYGPTIEGLEERLALSAISQGGHAPSPVLKVAKATTAVVATSPITPGPPDAGTDQGTLAELVAFSKAYPSFRGQPNYNPAFDLDHNGQVGQTDAKILLRQLPPVSPKIPLVLNVAIAPADRARGHVPTNLGGATHKRIPKIVGHTTPGALIFTGTGTTDAKLKGPVLVADSQGNFSLTLVQSDGINNLDLVAVDAYGQQSQFRAFPILWLNFAQYQAAHPRKT